MTLAEELLAHGYKEHKLSPPFSKHSDAFFQKRITRDGKTLFFIDAYLYCYSNKGTGTCPDQVSIEVYFYDASENQFEFSFRMYDTLEETEKFLLAFYEKNGFVPNPHHND